MTDQYDEKAREWLRSNVGYRNSTVVPVLTSTLESLAALLRETAIEAKIEALKAIPYNMHDYEGTSDLIVEMRHSHETELAALRGEKEK